MKLKALITGIFLGLIITVNAQKSQIPEESIDSAYWSIQKNTFRINLSFPFITAGEIPDGTGILTGMYEWSIKRNFSLVSRIGINTYDYPYETFLKKYSYQATASVEQRYYFNFKRRIKKEKPIKNHSGAYLGLEARYLSNAYISPDDQSFRTPLPGFKLYYNIGHQVQKGNYFINYHFGIQSNLGSVTSGIGIGRVF
jgi:hypothetical protein